MPPCPLLHWHRVSELIFHIWIPFLSWKFEASCVTDVNSTLKKGWVEASCCVSLGNSFQLSAPQFLCLKFRKDGDRSNQGFQTSTIYPAPAWVCHVGPPASLYMEYVPPNWLTLKRKFHIAMECVPLWATWQEKGHASLAQPGPAFGLRVLWGPNPNLKEMVAGACHVNVPPLP